MYFRGVSAFGIVVVFGIEVGFAGSLIQFARIENLRLFEQYLTRPHQEVKQNKIGD